MDSEVRIKVSVMGNQGAGTSSLIKQFAEQTFEEAYISTIGIDFKMKSIDYLGKIVKFQMWDTSGNPKFRDMRIAYLQTAVGIIILIDLTNPDALDSASELLKEAKDASETAQKMLVGTKADLSLERKVEFLDAQGFADEHGLKYCEASSKTGEGVKAAFEVMAQLVMDAKTD